jgi:hypothetical protein
LGNLQPRDFVTATSHVTTDDMKKLVLVSADPLRFADRLSELAALGFASVYVHNVADNQVAFIQMFGPKSCRGCAKHRLLSIRRSTLWLRRRS